MKISIHKNGIFLGSKFFPLLDESCFFNNNVKTREDLLKLFQKKFKSIEKLNEIYFTNYDYFEDLFEDSIRGGTIWPLKIDFINSLMAIDFIKFRSIWEESNFYEANKVKSNVLILENVNFSSFIRTKNRYYPLSIELLKVLGLSKQVFIDDLDIEFIKSFSLNNKFMDDLIRESILYNYKNSDVLREEMSHYKTIILFSDLLIEKSLEDRLLQHVDNGGILVVLGKIYSLNKYFTRPKITIVESSNSPEIKVFDHGNGSIISLYISGDKIDYSLVEVINNIMDAKMEKRDPLDPLKKVFCNFLYERYFDNVSAMEIFDTNLISTKIIKSIKKSNKLVVDLPKLRLDIIEILSDIEVNKDIFLATGALDVFMEGLMKRRSITLKKL